LTRFLHDGKIPVHNNRSELELRRLVVGRANWLFVGSDESAEWTCTFVSIVASCQLHGLDPEGYLRDLFRLLPVWPQTRFLELSPKHWRATRARLDDVELALPLGPITIPPRAAEAAQEAHADQVDVAHGR
jgi:transposase